MDMDMDMENISKFNDFINEGKINTSDIRQIYDEFGIDVHDVPSGIQSQLNDLIKELIKYRNKK